MNNSQQSPCIADVSTRLYDVTASLKEFANMFDDDENGGKAHILRLLAEDVEECIESLEEVTLPDTTHLLPAPPPPWERQRKRHPRKFRLVAA